MTGTNEEDAGATPIAKPRPARNTASGEGTPLGAPATVDGAAGDGSTDAVAASLDAIVDDVQPDQGQAVKWAAAELLRGRPFEAVTADLVAQNWPAASAEAIVEDAREQTRHERGVRTREDVVRVAEQRYQRSLRYVRVMIIIALAVIFFIIMKVYNW